MTTIDEVRECFAQHKKVQYFFKSIGWYTIESLNEIDENDDVSKYRIKPDVPDEKVMSRGQLCKWLDKDNHTMARFVKDGQSLTPIFDAAVYYEKYNHETYNMPISDNTYIYVDGKLERPLLKYFD